MSDIFGGDTTAIPDSGTESAEEMTAETEETGETEQPTDPEQIEGKERQPAEAGDEETEASEEQDPPPANPVTAEQLAQGYLGLERAARETQQQPNKPGSEPAGDPNEIVLNLLAQDPIGTIQYFIDQAIAPERERNNAAALGRNLETIMTQYPKQLAAEGGAQALFDRVSDIAKELGNPGLVRQPSPRLLHMAAQELWGAETRQQTYDKAKAAARAEAEAARRNKRGLSAPAGAKAQKEQPKSEADKIKEAIRSASGNGGIFG